MDNFIWMNSYVPGNVTQSLIGIVVNNMEVFNTGVCVSKPQLACNAHETEC